MSNYQVPKQAEGNYIAMAEGIKRKTLVFGDKTLLCKFQFDQGAEVPMHSHPYEQDLSLQAIFAFSSSSSSSSRFSSS